MWKNVIEELGWTGRYVTIWTFNWIYRGKVKAVTTQCIVLEDVHVVEDSGIATSEKPKQETEVPSSMIVSLDAIEQICIPSWSSYNAKLPDGEK